MCRTRVLAWFLTFLVIALSLSMGTVSAKGQVWGGALTQDFVNKNDCGGAFAARGGIITPAANPASFIGDTEEIAYDDGELDGGYISQVSGNGIGMRFSPAGPATLAGASVYLYDTVWPEPGRYKLSVAVYDCSDNGEPGEIVIAPFEVEATREGWNYIDLSSYGYTTSEDFFIIYVQVGNINNAGIVALDLNNPAGRTYYLYRGELSPRDDLGNVMIRASVNYPVSRLAGRNRYETAVRVSKAGWDTAETVVLARGDHYADALSGAPLAYSLDAPILLTNPAKLSQVTAEEISRLGAKKVIILGGEEAINGVVEKALGEMGLTTDRISGRNRFLTSAQIARLMTPSGSERVVLASGMNFPDALSAGAYAARQGIPIILSRGDRLSPEAADVISELNVVTTILVGGDAILSKVIEGAVPGPIRIVGDNRYSTSVKAAEYFNPGSTLTFVATGMQFADALSGAVLAAKNDSGILLVGKKLSDNTRDYLSAEERPEIVLFGGEGAVSKKLRNEILAIFH